jgi:BlaI family penicillinase repressor
MLRFTPGEMHVMTLLWEHGEMKPAQIQSLFPEPIKNPALRSYLAILLSKGHVTRRKVGKAYFYKATTRQQSAFRSTIREMLAAYGGGSVKTLMLNLIKSEKISAAELLELKRIADGEPSTERSRRENR